MTRTGTRFVMVALLAGCSAQSAPASDAGIDAQIVERTDAGQPEQQPIESCALVGALQPDVSADQHASEQREQEEPLRPHGVGDRNDDPCRERQLRLEARVELREGRDHLDRDDAHQEDRQGDQDHRVDQRGDRLRPDLIDDLRVRDVAPEHGVEVAGPLTG